MSVDLFKYTVWNADTTGHMHPGSSSDIKCGPSFCSTEDYNEDEDSIVVAL